MFAVQVSMPLKMDDGFWLADPTEDSEILVHVLCMPKTEIRFGFWPPASAKI